MFIKSFEITYVINNTNIVLFLFFAGIFFLFEETFTKNSKEN